MRKIFLICLFVFLSGCGYSDNGSQENPVRAKPLIVESTDGSRYKCQGVESNTYGGFVGVSVFDCQKIEK